MNTVKMIVTSRRVRAVAILVTAALAVAGCSEIEGLLPAGDSETGHMDEDLADHADAHEDAAAHVADAGEHEDHDEYAGHEPGRVHLTPERLRTLNITTAVVRHGSVSMALALPAETQFDPDRVSHLVPRVAGIVREVHAGIGDRVSAGDLMAVLDSRELAEAKSKYLADLAMRDLAQSTYEREERLWERKVSSEQDYLEAKQAFEEAKIRVTTAEQQLHALGLSEEDVDSLPDQEDTSLTRYEIRAPFDATVIRRHISLGETVQERDQVFFIAQLDPLWVMGQATERDLRRIRPGQSAVIELDAFPGEVFNGAVDYVASALDPESRTVDVRVVLPNPNARLRAHMFGRMVVFLEEHEHAEAFLVPIDAVQRTDQGEVVYKVVEEGVFEQVAIEVLHASDDFAEIHGLLEEGDLVAAGDTFVLKSEAGKEQMGGGHSH